MKKECEQCTASIIDHGWPCINCTKDEDGVEIISLKKYDKNTNRSGIKY